MLVLHRDELLKLRFFGKLVMLLVNTDLAYLVAVFIYEKY